MEADLVNLLNLSTVNLCLVKNAIKSSVCFILVVQKASYQDYIHFSLNFLKKVRVK